MKTGPAFDSSIALFLASQLLLAIGCGGAPAHGEPSRRAGSEGVLTVHVVRPQTDADDDSFPSSLYVEHDVQVTARRPGVVEAVFVDRGARVRKGQSLARVEAEAAERQLDLAVTDERLARAEYERLFALSRQQIVSPQDLERAETVLKRATSRTAIARNDLDRCTVAAPFDGVVAERWAVVGRRVTDDADSPPLFRVVASEPLRARVDVPEEQLPGIVRGGQAWIDAPHGGSARPARVIFMSPAIDAASGTASVIVETADRSAGTSGGDGLRPGAAVRVRFQPAGRSARPTALGLPEEAFSSASARGEDATILVVEGGRARPRTVKVVGRAAGTVRVRGALSPTDLVIIPAGPISAGSAVSIAEAPR